MKFEKTKSNDVNQFIDFISISNAILNCSADLFSLPNLPGKFDNKNNPFYS